ncbi:MAG TPA: flagellar basal body rod C-terminal domain-containing protein [Caulobacteraceae bacterium]|nr:flagellar basal body rod C-terminal domain-containing protein [Caulobacteraceae bacterium]
MTPAAAIAGSGLAAATLGLTVSAANLANANDTSAPGAKSAYAPRAVRQTPAPGGGVSAQAVTVRTAQLLVYDPASPVAGANGLVQTPEIDPVSEITNQITAGRAFAFSLEALKAANDEQKQLLDLKT